MKQQTNHLKQTEYTKTSMKRLANNSYAVEIT